MGLDWFALELSRVSEGILRHPMDIEFLLGILAVIAGLTAAIRPRIVYWIAEKTNLRWARWWYGGLDDSTMERYRRATAFLRWAIVLFLILFGTLLMLDSLHSLRR
jgi:hypothetical protein